MSTECTSFSKPLKKRCILQKLWKDKNGFYFSIVLPTQCPHGQGGVVMLKLTGVDRGRWFENWQKYADIPYG